MSKQKQIFNAILILLGLEKVFQNTSLNHFNLVLINKYSTNFSIGEGIFGY